MVEINIRDKNFGGEPSSCHRGVNKHVKWCFENRLVSKSCFITDMCLEDVRRAGGVKRKIAWILEPRAIHPHVYAWIEENNRFFDYVLTFDTDLIEKGENYLYYPHGRCWIYEYEKPEMYEKYYNQDGFNYDCKDKFCSIFASPKRFTPGHRLRHDVIAKHRGVLDVFGREYTYVENKIDGLINYKFSITIENNNTQRGYWTEKIVDCFATRTIPIYFGDTSVCDFFDKKGILFFKDMQELDKILDKNYLNDYFEECKEKGILDDNYNRVSKYAIPEDWIYLNYPFLMN